MSIRWFTDQSAKLTFDNIKSELNTFVLRAFPKYELSHFGINRNEDTEEVIIKLHLNIIGRVKVNKTNLLSKD